MERLAVTRPCLVFIGMPSSGKTTVGGEAAELLGADFIDFDAEIERRSGMTPGEIFAQKGEEYFRKLETELAREISGLSGAVISPGGGIVLKHENMELLGKNGVICRLTRDLSLIETAGRPLLREAGAVERLARQREPLYRRYADFTVDNNGTVAECAKKAVDGYLRRLK